MAKRFLGMLQVIGLRVLAIIPEDHLVSGLKLIKVLEMIIGELLRLRLCEIHQTPHSVKIVGLKLLYSLLDRALLKAEGASLV